MGLRDKFEELKGWATKKRDQNAADQQAVRPNRRFNPDGTPVVKQDPDTASSGQQQDQSDPQNTSGRFSQTQSGSQAQSAADQSSSGRWRSNSVNTSITLSQLALQNLQDLEYDYDEASGPNAKLPLGQQQQPSQQQPGAPAAMPADATAPMPVPALCGMEGQIINGLYRIEKLLAQGGMGQVFLASHLGRGEIPVVLKLLLKQPDRNSTEYNRFLQEMLISSRMKHPNIIKVYDYGILLDGLKPYLVIEYVDGEPLRHVLRRQGTISVTEAAKILTQSCDGLHEVHAKGIVHRDLKPENLMIKGDYRALDNVKILDFGIAQLQRSQKFDEEGLAVGSVGYMSPEQICAQPVDHRTDIYSLGLILYESVTGHPPFVGSTRRETMAMHVQAKHMPPSAMASIPQGSLVDRIVDKALAKHPDHRYQHVREMQQDLAELLNALSSWEAK